MPVFVINPKSHRLIDTSKDTYKKMKRQGVKFDPKTKFEFQVPKNSWGYSRTLDTKTRRRLYEECEKCFLVPPKNGQRPKYPVCRTGDAGCRVDCALIKAALTRASMNKHYNVYREAVRLLQRHCAV